MPLDQAGFVLPPPVLTEQQECDRAILEQALTGVRGRGRWVKGFYGVWDTVAGSFTDQHCLVGWLKVGAGDYGRAEDIAKRCLLPLLPYKVAHLEMWNDRSRTRKKDVITLLERAIAQVGCQ